MSCLAAVMLWCCCGAAVVVSMVATPKKAGSSGPGRVHGARPPLAAEPPQPSRPSRRLAVTLGWVALLRQLQPAGRADYLLARVRLPAEAVRGARRAAQVRWCTRAGSSGHHYWGSGDWQLLAHPRPHACSPPPCPAAVAPAAEPAAALGDGRALAAAGPAPWPAAVAAPAGAPRARAGLGLCSAAAGWQLQLALC